MNNDIIGMYICSNCGAPVKSGSSCTCNLIDVPTIQNKPTVSAADIFSMFVKYRNDEKHHIGLGGAIRLTLGDQEDILAVIKAMQNEIENKNQDIVNLESHLKRHEIITMGQMVELQECVKELEQAQIKHMDRINELTGRAMIWNDIKNKGLPQGDFLKMLTIKGCNDVSQGWYDSTIGEWKDDNDVVISDNVIAWAERIKPYKP